VASRQLTRRFLTGALTFIPPVAKLEEQWGRPGPNSSHYGYAVWLRHLVGMARAGLATDPATVVEVGPGSSLAAGVCALLCGAEHYYAWDPVAHTSVTANISLLDELVERFRRRAPAPEGDFTGRLFERRFPDDVLPEDRMQQALASARVEAIGAALRQPGIECDGIRIDYREDPSHFVRPADLVFSQAVMEHVGNVGDEYRRIKEILAPGGVMSHEIDFDSHRFTRDWNGHWAIPEWQWRVARGRRRYAINRASLTDHLKAIQAAGFEIAAIFRITRPSAISRRQLQPRFAAISSADMSTRAALVQAVRS
jgi:SAM-dependent methyltransferase